MDKQARRIEAVEAATFADQAHAAGCLPDLDLRQHVRDGVRRGVFKG